MTIGIVARHLVATKSQRMFDLKHLVSSSQSRMIAFGSLKRQRNFSTGVDPGIAAHLTKAFGIEERLHKGVLRAMKSAYGKEPSASMMDEFGAAGMKALAASVEQELKKAGTKKRVTRTVHFEIPHHKTEFDLKWKQGDSLLDVAQSPMGEELLSEYMEGTCGGQMSCCTCHVYLDKKTLAMLPPPTGGELDMLDLAYERNDSSRLGCQVQLSGDLLKEGHTVTVTIPAGVNNVWN